VEEGEGLGGDEELRTCLLLVWIGRVMFRFELGAHQHQHRQAETLSATEGAVVGRHGMVRMRTVSSVERTPSLSLSLSLSLSQLRSRHR
jgi:hypothetical protein